jgi:predicted esterase
MLTFAQSSLPTGQIIERIQVLSTDQSYSVFLPSQYTPTKSWPTVFCLDPRGRGKFAIERFTKPAEKYGYIVLCSNDSRNGLDWGLISQIFTKFWDDAHQRFNIDQNRTYAAGFSGGARLSATFASRCRGCLAGVILAGASFPQDIQPDAKTTFITYGIIGVDDFNFGEYLDLEQKYRKLATPYHIEAFAGGHEWAPDLNLDQALAWFILHAMKSGTVPKDEKFLDEQLAERVQAVAEQVAAQKTGDALRSLQSIIRDFHGLRDTKTAASRFTELQQKFDSRKEEKAENELVQRQLREVGEIRTLWMKPLNPDETSSPRHEATRRLADWRKKKELAEDVRERRLARRILSHLLVQSYEMAQAGIRSKDYADVLQNYSLTRELDPKNPYVLYEMARVYALKRDKKPAVEMLEDAVALGFKDVARLKAEEAFSVLSADLRFQKLVQALSVPQ